MTVGRLCIWALVLVFVAAPAPRRVQVAPNNNSLNCGKEPESYVGLGDSCTCKEGCDAEQNLLCIAGQCRCQPDSVIFEQRCLLKSRYNESCEADQQCQDPHQTCDPDTDRCRCRPGFNETTDDGTSLASVCRPTNGSGKLGDNCSTVADCSWQLEHAICPIGSRVCSCQAFYYGQPGGLECNERDWYFQWTWWITICLIAAVVIGIGIFLILSCTIRECYRSHKRIRGRVIAVAGPVGKIDQQPPPYVAVIDTKPPPYTASTADEGCMDNYGFTSCELEPYTTKKA